MYKRQIWGHPQQFESIGICVTSLGFRVMVKKVISSILFRFGHNVLDWTALPWIFFSFLLIFETFLGGALRHNVYRGYIVFWGTIIYCSLACISNKETVPSFPRTAQYRQNEALSAALPLTSP